MQQSRLYTRKSRWYTPVMLAAFFGFCSLSGLLWGLAVRTPHPNINSIAVLPNARDVATPTSKPVGLASPTMEELNSTSEGLLNYEFRTSDPPDKIVAFYKELMLRRYGFQNWSLAEPSPEVQVLSFVREITFRVRGWDKERVTVSIAQEDADTTKVEVHQYVEPFTSN